MSVMKTNFVYKFLYTCLFLIYVSCTISEKNEVILESKSSIKNISYNNFNELDVFYYDNFEKLRPVIIFFHGGAWVGGDKSEWTENHSNFFLDKGYINVSANYNLNNKNDQIEDICRVIKWVYDNIEIYGGDKDNIFLFGFSAGAHLVSLITTNRNYINKLSLDIKLIRGVCAYDGGPYLGTIDMVAGSYIEYQFKTFFGEKKSDWEDVLPYYHIKDEKYKPPFLLIAESDDYVRINSNKIFASKLRKHDHIVTEVYIEECDHWSIFYEKIFSDNVSNSIIDFLNNN